MSETQLLDLVTDWGGFERLVAQLHETGAVTVEHNVLLEGRSGALRQVDVLVRHKEGLYEHLIVVECKYRNSPIERIHVDALATTIREVGAARGVIFSTEGFQSGAIAQAKHDNIALFRVREPTDEEWGLPGRHIDLWLNVLSIGLSGPRFPNAKVFTLRPDLPIRLELQLGFPEHLSHTPARIGEGPETTLERLIEKVARRSAKLAYRPARIDFGEGTWTGVTRGVSRVQVKPKHPIEIRLSNAILYAPEMNFELGVRVDQSRIQIDRAQRYAFALAVEDCIRNVVSTASRERGERVTQLSEFRRRDANSQEILENGSIMQVWAGPFAAWSEFEGLEIPHGEIVELSLEAEGLV